MGDCVGDWVWDGGRSSVDLLNTLRDRVRGGRETLHTPDDLARWLREAGFTQIGAAGPADLAAARRLRGAIDSAVFAAAEGRPVPDAAAQAINEVAGAVPLAPRLALDAAGRPSRVPSGPAVATALAQVAVDAIDLVTGAETGRLRVCAADDCGLRFVDRSPARNRQWCSMRRCGNRAKAGRHYARGRARS
ncbi:ABATE domain-containing protein [Spirillospora sp. NPDC029432]|uniref:CGNR zinc finger domain-containing protein n=1 Tax=Spirillospora sp. NPDC029432 TaxID=3154599 RepID=UPI0034524A3E